VVFDGEEGIDGGGGSRVMKEGGLVEMEVEEEKKGVRERN